MMNLKNKRKSLTRACTRNIMKDFVSCKRSTRTFAQPIQHLVSRKRSQEEMVGFAIIMVIVFVIILVFLGFSLSNSEKDAVESYEAESFMNSMLSYTTSCGDYREVYLDVKDVIFRCYENRTCVNGNESCDILTTTLKGLLLESWKVGANSSVKGYSLDIIGGEEVLVTLERGIRTNNAKGAVETIPQRGKSVEVRFIAYY